MGGFRNVCARVSYLSPSDFLFCSQFLLICISAFIGFLIYAEALAYTTPQAWLHLIPEDVWPSVPACALLVCWRFIILIVSLLACFKVISDPYLMMRTWWFVHSACFSWFLMVFMASSKVMFYCTLWKCIIEQVLSQKAFLNYYYSFQI